MYHFLYGGPGGREQTFVGFAQRFCGYNREHY